MVTYNALLQAEVAAEARGGSGWPRGRLTLNSLLHKGRCGIMSRDLP
jgi:hypothetical protein